MIAHKANLSTVPTKDCIYESIQCVCLDKYAEYVMLIRTHKILGGEHADLVIFQIRNFWWVLFMHLNLVHLKGRWKRAVLGVPVALRVSSTLPQYGKSNLIKTCSH